MSSFLPENLADDPIASKKDLEDEHTRELQIEEAFKLFQRALELQKDSLYSEAYKLYEDIFKLEVISNHYYEEEDYIKGLQNGSSNNVINELSFLSPNVKTLRYLVFRNRGFLYYHLLKSGQKEIQKLDSSSGKDEKESDDEEKFKQIFYSMIDDFIICFVYQEVDEEILKLLYQIFYYLKLLRLEKFTIEYSLSSSQESQDILGYLPTDKLSLKKMEHLKSKLQTSFSDHNPMQDRIEQSLRFLEPIRQDLEVQKEKAYSLNGSDITFHNKIDWSTVIDLLNSRVKQGYDKTKVQSLARSKLKDPDGYLLTETPLERFKFILPKSKEDQGDDIPVEGEDEVEEKENSIGTNAEEPKTEIGADATNENDEKSVSPPEKKEEQLAVSPMLKSTAEKAASDDDDDDENEVFFEVKEDFVSAESSPKKQPQPSALPTPILPLGKMSPELTSNISEEDSDSKRRTIQRSSKRLQRNEMAADIIEIQITETTFIETTKFFETLNDYFQKVSKKAKLDNIVSIYVKGEEGNDSISGDFMYALDKWSKTYTPNLFMNASITPEASTKDSTTHPVAPVISSSESVDGSVNANAAGNASIQEAGSSNEGESGTELEKKRLLEVLNSFELKEKQPALSTTQNVIKLSSIETPHEIRKFLHASQKVHFDNFRFSIIQRLFSSKDGQHGNGESGSLIVETLWEPKLIKLVKDMIIQCESSILNKFKANLFQGGIETIDMSIAIGIFEILIDSFMTVKANISNAYNTSKRRPLKSNKHIFTNLHLESMKYQDKLKRWKSFIEDYIYFLGKAKIQRKSVEEKKIWYRYSWAITFYEKAISDSYSCGPISSILQDLLDSIIKNKDNDIKIPMLNYEHILEFSLDRIKSRMNTTSILAVFSKILDSNGDNNEAKTLLEKILIEQVDEQTEQQTNDVPQKRRTRSRTQSEDKLKASTKVEEPQVDPISLSIKPIKEFLNSSKIDMKLSLWNILFSFYNETNELEQFQTGFEKLSQFLILYLNSPNYTNADDEGANSIDKSSIPLKKIPNLIKVIGCFGDYLVMFLDKLRANKWSLNNTDTMLGTLTNLLSMFELLYLFSLHEESAIISTTRTSISASSKKAYDKLKDILVHTASMIFIYYKESLKYQNGENRKTLEVIHDLLCTMHEQLGLRRLCDSGSGMFLKLTQDVLSELNESLDCEKDLIQVISCRYHYKLTIDNFTPVDHETAEAENLDLVSTVELSKLILPLCFKKNPVLFPPKADMKMIIDAFFEVVGEPDIEADPILNENNQRLNLFFDSTVLTPKFLRESFHGLVNSGLKSSPKNPLSNLVYNGLYYLQGLLVFTAYKIRKKSMQSRAVELENIIKLLKCDLLFGSNRVESWFLLGQAFGYLVEDDLIWTSDKLIFPERKTTTANIQRKSLLCYLMAINEALRCDDEELKQRLVKPIFGSIMSHFAKEMYNACLKPMDMHAFKVQSNPKFVRSEDGSSEGTFVSVSSRSPTPLRLCFKIIQQSLHMAINENSSDWTNFYYLSKVQNKLNLPTDLVLETLIRSGDLAYEVSNPSDPIVEPHYRLCSLVYKYVKADKISIKSAIEFLKTDKVLSQQSFDSIETQPDFFQHVILCLKKVMSYDKKKWHHKPRFRLSKIYYDSFDDLSSAKEEMGNIVSLKATSKTLVSIWKPENERPGKHFHYTFEYALLYIVLLTKEMNLSSLIQMLPKLRRSNSTMVSLFTAWETLCSSISRIIRESLSVTDSLTETFLQNTTYQNFVLHSKSMTEYMKQKENEKDGGIPKEVEIHLCYLYAISDMKKYNNGYGPTSLIDDTIVAVYIRIYEIFADKYNKVDTEKDITDSPSGRPKKLAKRDVFPFISDILKYTRREIEDLLKEKPDIYNDFVLERYNERKSKALEKGEEAEGEQKDENKTTPQPPETIEEEPQGPLIESEPTSNKVSAAQENGNGVPSAVDESKLKANNGNQVESSDVVEVEELEHSTNETSQKHSLEGSIDNNPAKKPKVASEDAIEIID